MKISIYCLILLMISIAAVGQTSDATLQKLIELSIIDRGQVKDFEVYLSRVDEKNKASYIGALFQSEFKKLTGHNYSPMTSITFGREKLKTDEQLKINKNLSDYLTKLRTCSLTNDKQFNYQSEKIRSSQYVHVLQLLSDLSNQITYEEWFSLENLKMHAKAFLEAKVMTNESFEKLINDATSGRIVSPYQLISYCKDAAYFDLSMYPDDPAQYVQQIHTEVSRLIPDLAFENFNYSIDVDEGESSKNYTSYELSVTLNANGKTYRQTSFILPANLRKDDLYFGKIDEQSFYQIFNKILADNHSSFRLHQARSRLHYGNIASYQYFGIIALANHQVDSLRDSNSLLGFSYENFESGLTSSQIDSAINAYEKIGLLNHLAPAQIEKAKGMINEQENRSINDVLACFPDVIHLFDMELSNLEDPYAELISEYAGISHGQFNPTSVSDNFNIRKKKATLKFSMNGKNYQRTFRINDDWIDADFFDFVKSVVKKNGSSGQFYELFTGGQEASIIYLRQEQYDFLKSEKFLVFSDQM